MGYMQECLDDLNKLEKKILDIALSDVAKYNEFKREIVQIKQELFNNGDDSEFGVDYASKKEFIARIQNLSIEIEWYMKGISLELKLEMEPSDEQGKGKIKKYRIGIYKSIIEVIKEAEEIDIEKLTKVAERWEEEKKSELQYSPIEMNVVEEILADVLIQYQLNYIEKNKKLPEGNVAEFCSLSCYERALREKLLQALQTMDKGVFERLELEKLLTTGTLEEMLASSQMWKAISGVEIDENARIEIGELKKSEEELDQKEENKEIVTVLPQRKHKDKLLLRVRKKNIFGKEVEKKISIKLEGNKLQRSKIPEKYRNNIVYIDIPEGIEYLESELFSNEKNLEFVEFPDSLETIGSAAFYGCKKLKEIKIPKGCKKIESSAFRETEALEEVDMSEANSLEEIGESAFEKCKKLKSIKIPKGCKKIGSDAFREAEALEKIDMSEANSLEKIGKSAFERCKKLKSIKIPKGCKKIGSDAFREAKALEKIDMSEANSLEEIGEGAFYGCEKLKEIKIPKGCKKIGSNAFRETEALEEVDMNEANSLEKIGKSAFERCKKLKSIKIPKGCKKIGSDAFWGAKALEEVDMSEANSLKGIGDYAFFDCRNLKKLVIPKKCKEIGKRTFAEAEALEKVDMSEANSLEKIGESAFFDCKNLKKLVIPERCKEIGMGAFWGAEALEEVDMSEANSLKGIGDYAFGNCKNLKQLKLPEECDINWEIFEGSGLKLEDVMKDYGEFKGIKIRESSEKTIKENIGSKSDSDERTRVGLIRKIVYAHFYHFVNLT